MTSAMGFVFLQLRPVPYADFLTYLLVMAFSLGFAICCLLIASYGHRKQDDYVLARKGIDLLQKQMTAFLQQTRDTAQKKPLNMQRMPFPPTTMISRQLYVRRTC